jgi:hypothetical protein
MKQVPNNKPSSTVRTETSPKTVAPAGAAFSINLGAAGTNDVNVYFFNRFKIEKDANFYVIYLGAALNGVVMDSHVVAMGIQDVQNCFVNSKDYVVALGNVSFDSPEEWARPVVNKEVLIANIAMFSNAGAIAELHFHNFLLHDFAMVSRGLRNKNDIMARTLLIVRSSIEVHKQLLGNLFRGLDKK